jgi:hypothetical protein
MPRSKNAVANWQNAKLQNAVQQLDSPNAFTDWQKAKISSQADIHFMTAILACSAWNITQDTEPGSGSALDNIIRE